MNLYRSAGAGFYLGYGVVLHDWLEWPLGLASTIDADKEWYPEIGGYRWYCRG